MFTIVDTAGWGDGSGAGPGRPTEEGVSIVFAARISGLGTYRPERIVDNESICTSIDSDPDWITSRTGIITRRRAEPGEATSDVALRAAVGALESAGTRDVDMLILATATPDFISPPTAPIVAEALGLGVIPAFDISAACTGFLYGLQVAASIVRSGGARRVLLVCAETASRFTDPTDRNTAAIFADGAGAVVIESADDLESDGVLGDVVLGADGLHHDLVMMPGYGGRDRASESLGSTTPFITMDGKPLFVQAVERMSEAVRESLDRNGLSVDDVAIFVPHQANGRIIDAVADELELGPDRVIVDIDQAGNTIAASIPLALGRALADGRLHRGDRVMLAAFGAGASWGATTFTWPALSTTAT
ncbi:3-oxoacyl-[acyl-carrier-protein] synthase 3 protein 5 [Tsukamurella sp. TY48]|nr:3-oxoacyl-[acyl-carrier-protein] synthase 3 protein 5 [Tsukamurella sp. TY48]